MKNLKMFCLSMNNNHLDIINSLNYTPVGLGDDTYTKEWMIDKIWQ